MQTTHVLQAILSRGKRPEENVVGRQKEVIHCLLVFHSLLHIVFLKISQISYFFSSLQVWSSIAVLSEKCLFFSRLWNHICVRDSTVIDYKEFLKNSGRSTVKENSTENEVPGMCSEKEWFHRPVTVLSLP